MHAYCICDTMYVCTVHYYNAPCSVLGLKKKGVHYVLSMVRSFPFLGYLGMQASPLSELTD